MRYGLLGVVLAKRPRRNKSAQTVPDDYFAAGPFEFARFGEIMVSRSRASPEQFKAMKAEMAAALPRVTKEIETLVASIATRVAGLPPDRLLHRAWWEHAAIAFGLVGEKCTDFDRIMAMRMIDYVQSVVASTRPHKPYTDELGEKDWAALTKDVRDLFTCLTLDYQMCRTADLQKRDPKADLELEEFRFRAETIWMNVRGERYQFHEPQALIDILAPHSDVLLDLFGIDAKNLVDELEKILLKLSHGLQETVTDMERFQQEMLLRLAQLEGKSEATDHETLRGEILKDTALAAQRDKIVGEFLGLDLFDVEKTARLPQALLDHLAWSPGEDGDFFAPGDFRGWPTRIWPTMRRPFIRINGHIFCFDPYSLFDNFYRVLQRIIFRLKPEYRQMWNDRQKTISEELPFVYLKRLLPGSHIYRQVYYRWRSKSGRVDWHEVDGLLIYDDHLFVVEVKAGAFTYTSPATDLTAHIDSLRNLVLAPASQGSRFVEYLNSELEVSIADSSHSEIGRIRRCDFRNVTVCAVTLDPFTELAARIQHLRAVGIDVGQCAVWVLSIDDLRMYADIFDNPLLFLHFVEQRIRAGRSEFVNLNDEVDHLGLYMAKNDYSSYAAKVAGERNVRLNLVGYRDSIDEYYDALSRGESPKLPRQSLPRRLEQIVGFLGVSNLAGRSEIASYLLDSATDLRGKLDNAIEEQLLSNRQRRRARPLSTYGDMRLTLFTWSTPVAREEASAVNHTRAVMIAAHETDRLLLELEYTDDDEIREVHWQHVTLRGLSDVELERLNIRSNEMRQQRVLAVQRQHKIGRNELCPCGSGEKYKRCCLV